MVGAALLPLIAASLAAMVRSVVVVQAAEAVALALAPPAATAGTAGGGCVILTFTPAVTSRVRVFNVMP